MKISNERQTFRLAPMSADILILTVVLLVIPVGFAVVAVGGAQVLFAPALLLTFIYLWIWLWFRPRRFHLSAQSLKLEWPLRSRHISRDEISSARLMGRSELKEEIGWGLRVGAGGFGGGFGWLWTKRRGLMRMYVSRSDAFVLIEMKHGQPWLITPEQPAAFRKALMTLD